MVTKFFKIWLALMGFIFIQGAMSAIYTNTTTSHRDLTLSSTNNNDKWIIVKPTTTTQPPTTCPPCVCSWTCPTTTTTKKPTTTTKKPTTTTRRSTTTTRKSTATTKRSTTTTTTTKPTPCRCGTGAHPSTRTLDAISDKYPLTTNVTDDERIIQGVISTPNAWPWMAALIFQGSGTGTFCGGSLINNWYVLTAAHCVQQIVADGTSANYRIYLGSNTIKGTDPNREIFQIASIIMHPRYDTTIAIGVPTNYDFALIRLKAQVKFSKIIHPVCLLSQTGAPYTGSNVIVTGWGLTSPGGITPSNQLREVAMKVIGQPSCAITYGNIINEDTICAIGSPATKGPCHGGAMVTFVPDTQSFTQIGVVSFVHECEKTGKPAVFGRVSSALKFIQQVTKSATYCTP